MTTHLDLMRDPAKHLTLPAAPLGIRTARIWHCGYRTLEALGDLPELEALVIATFPDDSLAILEHLTQLRYLRIVHLPKVSSLAPLAALSRLRSLSLATLPSWDGSKKIVVDSLAPLTELPALEHLELFGICAPDNSLAPLERCTHLRSVRVNGYLRKETARFYSATGLSDDFIPPPSFGD